MLATLGVQECSHCEPEIIGVTCSPDDVKHNQMQEDAARVETHIHTRCFRLGLVVHPPNSFECLFPTCSFPPAPNALATGGIMIEICIS